MTALAAAPPHRTQPELIGFVAAAIAHVVLLVVLSMPGAPEDVELPPAMEVSFVEETGPVSSAPITSAEPAPTFGEELAPAEEVSGADATLSADPPPDPVVVAERTPSIPRDRPEQALRERRSNQPTVRREVTPPTRSQPPPTRQRSFADIAASIGRPTTRPQGPQRGQSGPPSPSAAPARLSGAQQQQLSRQIGTLIQPCSARTSPPNPLARRISVDLRVTVGPNGAYQSHSVVSVSDPDDSGYGSNVVDVAVRAVRACASRIATLPDDHYAIPGGWRTFRYRFRFP